MEVFQQENFERTKLEKLEADYENFDTEPVKENVAPTHNFAVFNQLKTIKQESVGSQTNTFETQENPSKDSQDNFFAKLKKEYGSSSKFNVSSNMTVQKMEIENHEVTTYANSMYTSDESATVASFDLNFEETHEPTEITYERSISPVLGSSQKVSQKTPAKKLQHKKYELSSDSDEGKISETASPPLKRQNRSSEMEWSPSIDIAQNQRIRKNDEIAVCRNEFKSDNKFEASKNFLRIHVLSDYSEYTKIVLRHYVKI